MESSSAEIVEAKEGVAGWRLWVAGAFAASIWHAFIDAQIGLLGPTSETMTLAQGGAIFFDSMLVGWWLFVGVGAAVGRTSSLGALALLILLGPVLTDGAVAFIVAPPPSAAFPFQDLAHFASLVLGVGALWSLRRTVGWGRWSWQSWVVVVLKVLGGVIGAAVFFTLPGS